MSVTVRVMRTEAADTSVPLPRYETTGAAGADVRANLPGGESLVLSPGARALVPTGLKMEIPEGYEIQMRPRSGLALKHGIALVNAPGTIDSDYRGPVGVIVLNTSDAAFEVTHGMRIAQMVLAPIRQASFEEVDRLQETTRGSGGFGSTGTD